MTLISETQILCLAVQSSPPQSVLPTSGNNFQEEKGRKLVRVISAESIYHCTYFILDALRTSQAVSCARYKSTTSGSGLNWPLYKGGCLIKVKSKLMEVNYVNTSESGGFQQHYLVIIKFGLGTHVS